MSYLKDETSFLNRCTWHNKSLDYPTHRSTHLPNKKVGFILLLLLSESLYLKIQKKLCILFRVKRKQVYRVESRGKNVEIHKSINLTWEGNGWHFNRFVEVSVVSESLLKYIFYLLKKKMFQEKTIL